MNIESALPILSDDIDDEIKQTVDLRKIHSWLGVKSKYADWVKNRINEYDFLQDVDFAVILKNKNNSINNNLGAPTKEYHATLGMAKEVAMVERNAKGREARKYFISCEKLAKQQTQLPQKVPLLQLANDMQQKYPHLNISDDNVISCNDLDIATPYWDEMQKYGLPVVNVLTKFRIQIEFMWFNWEMHGDAKKLALFAKLETVCEGYPSYNDCRKFAFHGLTENQSDEWVQGFKNILEAKRLATKMQQAIHESLIPNGLKRLN